MITTLRELFEMYDQVCENVNLRSGGKNVFVDQIKELITSAIVQVKGNFGDGTLKNQVKFIPTLSEIEDYLREDAFFAHHVMNAKN